MIYRQLGNTGLQVSQVGFGCVSLGDEYGGITDENSTRLVHAAIECDSEHVKNFTFHRFCAWIQIESRIN